MNAKYTFPDETQPLKGKDESKDDIKVEIVDDTPPVDRGRQPLPKELVKELDEDDLGEYSDRVKQRIAQARKAFHDERRAKEAAAREKEEAVQFAQIQFHENQALKQRLGAGEKIFITEVNKAAKTELDAARAKLKEALEAGDAEKIVAAQETLNSAQVKVSEVSRFQPTPLQQESQVVQPPQQTRAPAPAPADSKAVTWRQNNGWFGQDEEMTALALGLHEKLVRSGVDPSSDDYYEQIDKTMRRRFPDHEGWEEATLSAETVQTPAPARKTNTIVAPATRSSAPRQIRLSASQAALAKRLGITPEAYAREVMKLESSNG